MNHITEFHDYGQIFKDIANKRQSLGRYSLPVDSGHEFSFSFLMSLLQDRDMLNIHL
jgi:hypothetical protein